MQPLIEFRDLFPGLPGAGRAENPVPVGRQDPVKGMTHHSEGEVVFGFRLNLVWTFRLELMFHPAKKKFSLPKKKAKHFHFSLDCVFRFPVAENGLGVLVGEYLCIGRQP